MSRIQIILFEELSYALSHSVMSKLIRQWRIYAN